MNMSKIICDYPKCNKEGFPEPDTKVNYCKEHSAEFNKLFDADLDNKDNMKAFIKFTVGTTINRIRNNPADMNNLAEGLSKIQNIFNKDGKEKRNKG